MVDTDPDATHANWMENFPFTRLPSTSAAGSKPMIDPNLLRMLPPFEVRQELEDGSYGGRVQRSDAEMAAIWDVAVDETRGMLEKW